MKEIPKELKQVLDQTLKDIKKAKGIKDDPEPVKKSTKVQPIPRKEQSKSILEEYKPKVNAKGEPEPIWPMAEEDKPRWRAELIQIKKNAVVVRKQKEEDDRVRREWEPKRQALLEEIRQLRGVKEAKPRKKRRSSLEKSIRMQEMF